MKQFEEIIAFEKRLIQTPLSNGKTLIELSTFNDIALWWFINFEFHYFLKNIYNNKKNKISSGSKNQYYLCKIWDYRLGLIGYIFDYLRKSILIIIFKMLSTSPSIQKLDEKDDVILFTGQDLAWRHGFDINSKEILKNDQNFISLINIMKNKPNNNYHLLSTYFLKFPYYNSIFFLIDKLKHWKISHIPYEIFFNKTVFIEGQNASQYFKNIWMELNNDPIFNEILNSLGLEISENIRIKIMMYYCHTFPRCIRYITTSKNLIEKIKPSFIALINEHGSFERSLIVAARMQGIYTLGIQHGNISKYSPEYICQNGEIAEDGRINAPFYQIPNITAVFGYYDYNLLTQVGGYPKNSVVVTGQPRYDILFEFSKKYDRKKLFELKQRWNLSPDKKIILWTTQSHDNSYCENILNLESIFRVLQIIKNVILIIKQHPGEGEQYTQIIHRVRSDYDVDVRIVPKNVDTFELLYISDLVITKHSTTGSEAIALNKPLLILNLSGAPDIMPYVDEGVALGVYNEEDLYPTITKLLTDDTELVENRPEFIRKYLYKFDGKASDRVVEVINKLI